MGRWNRFMRLTSSSGRKWLLATIVASILALVLAGVAILQRGEVQLAGQERGAQETVAFLGDSYTGGSGEGGQGDANFTRLLATKYGFEAENFAVGGTGYVMGGVLNTPFITQVERLSGLPDVKIVIIEGSRNDLSFPPGEVEVRCEQALQRIRQIKPSATLLVIGPVLPVDGPLSSAEIDGRESIRRASVLNGAIFADPLDGKWLDPSLIGRDQVHPTDAGHEKMADEIGNLLEQNGLV